MAKISLTAARVAGFKCPPDKRQAFLWDSTVPGLGLRVTPAGKPAYVFQGEYARNTVRITIGSPVAWSIPQAQAKVRELQRLIDEGVDPRELKREALATVAQEKAHAASQAITVGEAWQQYLIERRPHWGERHLHDNMSLSSAGGEPSKRGMTRPGPLAAFMPLPLRDLDTSTIEAWAAHEAQSRPTQARLAWRLLRAFLAWCTEHPEFAAIVPERNPAKSRRAREALGKPGVKSDALLKEQLPAWFNAVGQLPATAAAYLQALLLTGARPGELLCLRWDDLNTQWRGMTIRDKVEGERVIPLTPHVHHLLTNLPRRGAFVFTGISDNKPMSRPYRHLAQACAVAGVAGLTLHGLRRSFKSLSEWLELPVGVVAQIQGHKPSATAEKHYTVRPLDLLRLHHERFEAWILDHAGLHRPDGAVDLGRREAG